MKPNKDYDIKFALYNWHIELTSKCALSCPRCQRTEEPENFDVKELSLNLIQKIFTKERIQDVQRITFSGNFGDPIYHSQFIEVVSYLKSTNPNCQIVIVTNGSFRKRSWWQSLAQLLTPIDEVIFSIDGWDQESNATYRVGADWESIMVALKIICSSKAYVRWSTIVFKHNYEHLDKIKTLSQNLGVDHFHIVLSERFGSHNKDYFNSDGVDPLEPPKEFVSNFKRTQRFQYKFPTKKWKSVSTFYQKFDLLYNSNLKKAQEEFSGRDVLPSCLYGYRGVFLDVNGIFTPCSWINHPYDKKDSPIYPNKEAQFSKSIAPYLNQLNLNSHTLEKVLLSPLWQKLYSGWKNPGDAYVVCERKCRNPETLKST